jgi:hypothetical protein
MPKKVERIGAEAGALLLADAEGLVVGEGAAEEGGAELPLPPPLLGLVSPLQAVRARTKAKATSPSGRRRLNVARSP